MSIFSRIFGRKPELPESPNEQAMHRALSEARKKNREAVEGLSSVAGKQVRDTELIRQVVGDILDRAEQRKLENNRKAAR